MAIIHSDSYIPYSSRAAYSDLTPIPQKDAEACLVPIMYSAEYTDATNIFRALVAKNERSYRVLEVTEHIIRLNPAHYSVWQYRFQTLMEMRSDLEQELELMNEFAQENLKSYQVWHHRLLLIKTLSPRSLSTEIGFIHTSLIPDPKNYHTWAYLHWLYAHFSSSTFSTPGEERISSQQWEQELRWCLEMIIEDGRNNSAWAWRWFLVFGREGAEGGKEEIEFALNEIRKIPHNASAWNYLRGAHNHLSIPFSSSLPSVLPYTTIPNPLHTTAHLSSPEQTSSSNPDTPLPVPFAIEWMADCKAEEGDRTGASILYKELGERWDVMRGSYWKYRAQQLTAQVKGSPSPKKKVHTEREDSGHLIIV